MRRSLLAAPRLATPAPPPAAAAARRGLRALVARSRKDVPEGEAASSLVDVAAVSALPRQDPKARDIEHSSIYRWCRASPSIHAAVRVTRTPPTTYIGLRTFSAEISPALNSVASSN